MRTYYLRHARQLDQHNRPAWGCALNAYGAPMVCNNLAYDCQAQTRPVRFARAHERIEYSAANIVRYAGSLVRDANLETILLRLHVHNHSTTRLNSSHLVISY